MTAPGIIEPDEADVDLEPGEPAESRAAYTETDPTFLFHRPAWMADGACRTPDGELVDWFFPEHRSRALDARAVCAVCPVQPECLQYAIDERIDEGIWGGLSSRERDDLYRDQRRAAGFATRHNFAQKPINHGTPGGYNTHIRRDDPPCDDCKNAKRIYEANRKAAA